MQAVSTRACYLFCRLVKALRQNIRQFVREVLQSIQGHLVRIATHPPTDGGQAAAKAGGPGGAKITTMGAFLPATDDRYSRLPCSGNMLCQACVVPGTSSSLLSTAKRYITTVAVRQKSCRRSPAGATYDGFLCTMTETLYEKEQGFMHNQPVKCNRSYRILSCLQTGSVAENCCGRAEQL